METQEDSLDLAYLKSAALGLNDSQRSLNSHAALAITHHLTSTAANYGRILEYGMVNQQQPSATTQMSTSSLRHDRFDTGTRESRQTPVIPKTNPSRLLQSNASPEPQDGEQSSLGDTQPVSQSVYEGLLDSRELSHDTFESPFRIPLHGKEATDGATTQITLNEGDTGHVDLFSGFDTAGEPANLREDDDGSQASETRDSSPTHYEPFPESQRFNISTPAVRLGRLSSYSSAITPSASRNPFGTGNKTPGSVMALSQLFNATQAASSPCAHLLPHAEPPSDMPSPNIPIQRPIRSTGIYSSSAVASYISRLNPMEPETNYVSMEESQAERERRLRKQLSDPGIPEKDDDIFGDGESTVERRIRQNRARNEARREFENIKAPARKTSLRSSKGSVSSLSPLTSLRVGRGQRISQTLSNEDELEIVCEGNQEEETEVETEQEEVILISQPDRSQRIQSFSEEDKENVDSGPIESANITLSTHSALSTALDLDQSPLINRQRRVDLPRTPAASFTISHFPKPELRSRPAWASQPETNGKPRTSSTRFDTQTKERSQVIADLRYGCPSTGQERTRRSPMIRIPSSPPLRDLNAILHAQLDDDNDVLSPQAQATPSPLLKGSTTKFSSHIARENRESNVTKLSSVTPQAFETPSFSALYTKNFLKTIPETSPAGQHLSISDSETMLRHTMRFKKVIDRSDDDNDGLPSRPQLEATIKSRSPRFQGIPGSHTSRRIQAIMSSPSGRIRRSMTAIASDESPRPAVSDIPIHEFCLVNAEDRMIQSMAAFDDSPIKRRRANDGSTIPSLVQRNQQDISRELEDLTANLMSPIDREAELQSEHESLKIPQTTTPPQPPASHCNDITTDIWEVQPSPEKLAEKPLSPQSTRRLKSTRKRNRASTRSKLEVIDAVVIHHPSSSSLSSLATPSHIPSSPSLIGGVTERSSSIYEYDQTSEESNHPIVAANHIFAFFKGRPSGYYPALCVGTCESATRQQLLIHFEDSNSPTKVESRGAKSLELKIGDLVKVNLPDAPKAPHYVTGFGPKIQPPNSTDECLSNWDKGMCDIYGHSTVRLKRKLTKVVPKERIPRTIVVPISKIYLDQNLWSRLGERSYSPKSLPGNSYDGAQQAMEISVQGRVTQSSQLPFLEPKHSGLFAGMAFALSYTGNEKRGKDIEALLSNNGGLVLKDGFDQLFEPTSWELSLPTTPTATAEQLQNGGALALYPSAKALGFTCLITDQYSRRAKYMQALALNIPCLASQWVYECIEQQKVVDWEQYLLAAGSSTILDNAVKSRILTPYPPSVAKLPSTITARPKIFAKQSMLFVMGRKQAAQQRRAYAFLVYALGAKRIYPVQTLQAALDVLLQGTDPDAGPTGWEKSRSRWDWIYVGDESAAATARAALSKVSSTSLLPDRPRGRSSNTSEGTTSKEKKADEEIRILDSELLCQFLIFGQSFDK